MEQLPLVSDTPCCFGDGGRDDDGNIDPTLTGTSQ
jgi:hypothetical protein